MKSEEIGDTTSRIPVQNLPDRPKKDQLPKDAQQKLPLLERLDFIGSGQNIVLAGNPGTGKTHIAVVLALKACVQGYKVLFTIVHRLLPNFVNPTHKGR